MNISPQGIRSSPYGLFSTQRADAHLIVAEIVEDELRRKRAPAYLARVDCRVLAHEEGQKIHGNYTRANALIGNVPKPRTFTGTAKKRSRPAVTAVPSCGFTAMPRTVTRAASS